MSRLRYDRAQAVGANRPTRCAHTRKPLREKPCDCEKPHVEHGPHFVRDDTEEEAA